MNIDYTYLRPPSNLRLLFNTTQNFNSLHERIIFENSNTYTPNEMEGVNKIYEYQKKRKPDKEYSKSLLLKMYHLGNYDMQDSIKKLDVYDEWHQEETILTYKSMNILESGVFYQYGKDQKHHPVIYFRPNLINLNKQPDYYTIDDYHQALKKFLDPIEQYMMVPGVVESWILVVDFDKQKVNIPIDSALKSIEKIAIAYPYRLKNILFINTTKQVLPYISNINQTLPKKLIDFSPPKSSMINSNSQLSHFIPTHEREKKYGGTLKNLEQYWPITITGKLLDESEEIIQNGSFTQFESIMNEIDFDMDKNLQGHGLCSSCTCNII